MSLREIWSRYSWVTAAICGMIGMPVVFFWLPWPPVMAVFMPVFLTICWELLIIMLVCWAETGRGYLA